MKKFKLTVKLSLVVALIISVLSICSVFAATYIEDGEWKYEKSTSQSDIVYFVAGYTGDSNSIRIPALFQSKAVVKINNNIFLNKTKLTYVEIPATIKYIGQLAFYGCSSLESISIPAGVTEIGPNAFYGCSSLATVTFRADSELKVIPQNTFSRCVSLTTVTLPEGLTSIGMNAFYGCSGLSAVTFGPYVTEIDSAAFKGCSNLTFIGWNNTYPQQFAEENGITFISLGDFVYPSDPMEPSIPTQTTPDESIPDTDPTVSEPTTSDPTAPATSEPATSDPTEPTKYPEGKTYIIGDTDLSGKVTVKDATLIQKYAASLVSLDKTQLFLANCNSTGDVNVKDATLIQKYCADYKNILFVGTEVVL